jgi:uncharacterized short protein YbdD (DUF466 family)
MIFIDLGCFRTYRYVQVQDSTISLSIASSQRLDHGLTDGSTDSYVRHEQTNPNKITNSRTAFTRTLHDRFFLRAKMV